MDSHREVLFGNSAEHYWRGYPHPVLRREVPQGPPPPSARGALTPLSLHLHRHGFHRNSDGDKISGPQNQGGVVPSPVPGVVPTPPPAPSEEGSPSYHPVPDEEGGPPPLSCMYKNAGSCGVPTERSPVPYVSDKGGSTHSYARTGAHPLPPVSVSEGGPYPSVPEGEVGGTSPLI